MAPILKDYPRASFDAIEFPFTDRTARLEARTHVHEYPKMAGGSVEKLGRNDPCPCGSGRKFKRCHGAGS